MAKPEGFQSRASQKLILDPSVVRITPTSRNRQFLSSPFECHNETDPQVFAGYLHDRLRGFAGITGQIEGFDATGDRVGTGNVVLVLTPDGRAVLSPKQP